MNILVTGGSGFLGSHVADALEDAGHSVTIFDRRPSPWKTAGQHMVMGDITNPDDVSHAAAGMDAVCHFAGIAGIEEYKNNPTQAVNVNIGGTLNVLNACVNNKVTRLLFASSAYVFSKFGGDVGVD